MLNAEPIRRRYGDYICRRCINREYRAHLKQSDCLYHYVAVCQLCHRTHHIVVDFTFGGKLKMLLRF